MTIAQQILNKLILQEGKTFYELRMTHPYLKDNQTFEYIFSVTLNDDEYVNLLPKIEIMTNGLTALVKDSMKRNGKMEVDYFYDDSPHANLIKIKSMKSISEPKGYKEVAYA